LCFQASRLDAREDDEGRPVLLRNQDRARWDRALIDIALGYLKNAMHGDHASRYHLEAGIASIYATAPTWEQIDWKVILTYYARLQQIADSPVVNLNACVAQAFAGEPEQSLSRIDALGREPILATYAPYHIARAEILRLLGREAEAKGSFCAAIGSGASVPVIQHLEHRLATSL
jgi:RNA polymerase sigma-70 factor (ECF subfamily)